MNERDNDMGLDTSHGAWSGAYSSFARWRNAVARADGIVVTTIPDEQLGTVRESYVLDWEAFVPENYQGEWSQTPADPLIVLLAHSDCDGVIHPQHAGPLADRLENLLPKLPDEHRSDTQQFIRGLRRAAAAGEDLDFH